MQEKQWEMSLFSIELSFIPMTFIASFHKYIIYLNGLVVASIGTYIRGSDPHLDPFYIWGNEIFMTDRQVRKLKKIVSRKRQEMRIKLFVYSLSKTTVNFRMVRTIQPSFFMLILSC